MDLLKSKELVAEKSKKLCADLQKIMHKTIRPTVFSANAICKLINYYLNKNKVIVSQNVTLMIILFIKLVYFGVDNGLQHVIDEVNAN